MLSSQRSPVRTAADEGKSLLLDIIKSLTNLIYKFNNTRKGFYIDLKYLSDFLILKNF